MAKNEKRIVVRVDPGKWQRLDDKRHAERTSFQEVGLELFDEWLIGARSGEKSVKTHESQPKLAELSDKVNVSGKIENLQISEAVAPWVKVLVDILQGGNEIAASALRSNLVAFMGYTKTAPKVADEYLNIAADEARLASLKQQMVDADPAPEVGGAADRETNRRRAPKEVVRKRV